MMQPRYFFLGLYRVPNWEYMCGMTIAQIELMSIDKPLSLCKSSESKKSPSKGEIIKAQKEWEDKYGNKSDKKVDAQSILSNFI